MLNENTPGLILFPIGAIYTLWELVKPLRHRAKPQTERERKLCNIMRFMDTLARQGN